MPNERYMTAKEAAKALDITVPTLYAYVSRGLIRSEAATTGKRQRRYYVEDVEHLQARKAGRQNPEQIAQDTLHWGTPVLESAITLITDHSFFYRGQDVSRLAHESSTEEVAALIWTGTMNRAETLFDAESHPSAQKYETMLLHIEVDGANLSPIQTFQTFLPIAAADDLTAYNLRSEKVAMTGARMLRLMASVAAGDVPEHVSVAEMLQRGWCPGNEDTIPLLDAALILCADHELNASSFAARVVASTGSTPYAVLLAGLAALQGTKHGGNTERVETLLKEVDTAQNIQDVIAAYLRRGDPIPGFGHKLYPKGDPRATVLLDLLSRQFPSAPTLEQAVAVMEAVQSLIGDAPTIDFALSILARTLTLAPGSALAIFGLGRTIGWIGQAIEQYEADWLIRPRARYIGQNPDTDVPHQL